MEILGIEQIPELHHDEQGEEKSHILTAHMCFRMILINESGKEVAFKDLWENVVSTLQFSEEEAMAKLSKFYSSLMIDGRFVTLGENTWDLRSRHKYEKVHIDMNEVYRDADEAVERDDDEDDLKDLDTNEPSEEENEEEKEKEDNY